MQTNLEKFVKTIGEIVREYRLETKKSIYKISAESSIPKNTWRRIEIGEQKDICLTSLWKIAQGTGIPLSEIIKELENRLGADFELVED